MRVLQYNQLDTKGVTKNLDKLLKQLQSGDFRSAEVKKLVPTDYYRAKLNYTDRVLFNIVKYNNEQVIVMLEIIRNHAYEKSRFLNGVKYNEKSVVDLDSIEMESLKSMPYINESSSRCYILDKIISFDDIQKNIFRHQLPLILIGSAGSGKTSLTLEKMKECIGNVLYVSHSLFLVKNARELYYANNYNNDDQKIDFLSYREFLETWHIPEGKEVTIQLFLEWYAKQRVKNKELNDGRKIFEEFKGVITGSDTEKAFLSEDEYLSLGIKQSIFPVEERGEVYKIFNRYKEYLKNEHLYDSNILSKKYRELVSPKYDAVIVDEVQDFTNSELHLILHALNDKTQFLLCGDANQIIHPNFFSWAKLKSKFYTSGLSDSAEITRVLTSNYRNSIEVTNIANRILKIKNARFGSIDKESNYLMVSTRGSAGNIAFMQKDSKQVESLGLKVNRSIKFAIIVLTDQKKNEAKKIFNTPLIFSVQEAKGLEYEHVILYDFIGPEKKYLSIVKGISEEDLQEELSYSRVKNKADKTLEAYKFYINALYVAATRSIKQLYLVESQEHHPLLKLLGLVKFSESISVDIKESTKEEWQQEAHRLSLQGKAEQAQLIKKQILGEKVVPWEILTKEKFDELKLQSEKSSVQNLKKIRMQLLEYAVFYHDRQEIERLSSLGFKAAKNSFWKASEIVKIKYFNFYQSSNANVVKGDVAQYGVDFKNLFNSTALHVATQYGNTSLVEALVQCGADKSLRDNYGMTPYLIAIRQSMENRKFCSKNFKEFIRLLEEDSLSIQSQSKLIKIDAKTIEFKILQLIFSCFRAWTASSTQSHYYLGFTAAGLSHEVNELPTAFLTERQKKQTYISSVLSRNEIDRDYPYNRKLFLRTRRGYYVLHPDLCLRVGDDWINIYELLAVNKEQVLLPKTAAFVESYAEELIS